LGAVAVVVAELLLVLISLQNNEVNEINIWYKI
jgi:hypothetical protein